MPGTTPKNRIAPFRRCEPLQGTAPWWTPDFDACQPGPAAAVPKRALPLEAAIARFRIGALEREVRSLRQQLREIHCEVKQLSEKAEGQTARQVEGYDPCLRDVLRVTQQLFPGEAGVEIVRDPENPDHSFVVFTVSAAGSPRDIVEKRVEWHQRVAKLRPGSSGSLRLSIVPV